MKITHLPNNITLLYHEDGPCAAVRPDDENHYRIDAFHALGGPHYTTVYVQTDEEAQHCAKVVVEQIAQEHRDNVFRRRAAWAILAEVFGE